MDSAELLNLLGNANRRRILQLLAQKPCYVTEISEYLGVSPKAVIDHLERLEDAGLVESMTDDRRRKYFSIARNLRLEVSVSPYEFGTKSAYAANPGLDISSCRHLSIRIEPDEPTGDEATDLADLARTLKRLEELENELSLAQRWVQGQVAGIREQIATSVEDGDPRIAARVLQAIGEDGAHIEELSEDLAVPPEVVEETLTDLAAAGAVRRDGRIWRLDD